MSVDEDRSPRAVGVRTPEGDFDWTLEPARDGNGLWTIALRSPDRTWRGTGHNCFAALRNLRSAPDSDGILIGVNGARRNALISGMQADMGEGRVMISGKSITSTKEAITIVIR